MKLSILCLALALAVAGQSQTPGPAASKPPAVTADQQKSFSEAMAAAEKAEQELALAKTKSDAAQNKLLASIYQIMALLKISPEEWRPVFTRETGNLTFERVEPAKPTAPGKP